MGGNIDASEFALDPDNQPSKISPKDWYRLLRMTAIDRHNTMILMRQIFGMKQIDFDDILRETAEDFNVPYEKLRDVKFHRFE